MFGTQTTQVLIFPGFEIYGNYCNIITLCSLQLSKRTDVL